MNLVERFARDGCLVIDRLFDPALIDRAREEYERQYGHIDPDDPPLHLNVGAGRLHLPIVFRGPLLDPELYAHPLLLTLLDKFFGSLFVIDNATIVTAMPGADDQQHHRDYPDLFPFGRGFDAGLPCYAITVAIPLIDLDTESGTTELFPGTMAISPSAGTEPSQPAILPFVKRGGCFLMDYRVWHRGRANLSDRPRPILYIVYAREWFTDVRNIKKHARFVIDPNEVNRIPHRLRPLFRRVAGKGLLDATINELQADPSAP